MRPLALGLVLALATDAIAGDGAIQVEREERFGDVVTSAKVGIELPTELSGERLSRAIERGLDDVRQHVSIVEPSISPWLELELRPADGLRVAASVHADGFWSSARPYGSRPDGLPQAKAALVLGPLDAGVGSAELRVGLKSGFDPDDALETVLEPRLTSAARGLHQEIGLRARLERLAVSSTLFLIDARSELALSTSGCLEPSVRTRRAGCTIAFELRVIDDLLTIGGDATWTDARAAGASPVARAPRVLLRGRASLALPLGLEAGAEVLHLGRRALDDGGAVRAPAQTALDLRLRWAPKENVEAFVHLENVLGVKWAEASASGADDLHLAPGKPFTVSAGLAVLF